MSDVQKYKNNFDVQIVSKNHLIYINLQTQYNINIYIYRIFKFPFLEYDVKLF